MIEWPSGKRHSSTCGLMLSRMMPGYAGQPGHVDLVVEVPDVGHDRLVLHPGHRLDGDDVLVAGGGDDDVGLVDHVLQPGHLVALQQRLQRADRVHLGHDHPRALPGQRGRRALADVAEAADQRDLAADQHVGGPVHAVDQRVPDAVDVVELALGHRVVDVDRREQQLPLLGELVEPVHAGGGLLGDAADLGGHPGPALRVRGQPAAQHVQDDPVLVAGLEVVVVDGGHDAGGLELDALVHQQGGVAAVVQDHVRAAGGVTGAPPAR